MNLHDLSFKRKFSCNPYQSLKLPVCEMSLCKDWVSDSRGDPYPVLRCAGDVHERIENASYTVNSTNGGEIARLLGVFFPYYSYSFIVCQAHYADVGIAVCDANGGRRVEVMLCGNRQFTVRTADEHWDLPCEAREGDTVTVTFRAGGVSVYLNHGAMPELIGDVSVPLLKEYLHYAIHASATCSLYTRLRANGKAVYRQVEGYLCGGLSHADPKPMKYEDGSPIVENGRLFLTVSSRLEKGCFQSVLSWNPTLCDFRMEGAIFYDIGDGKCCDDVAASVVYDRRAQE